jgi:hypothetical protein
MTGLTTILVASIAGCGASSAEEQRRAVQHQQNADQAADKGQYGVAGEEQRRAEDSHASAVQKAMDNGEPIPRQTQKGDKVPPPPQQ